MKNPNQMYNIEDFQAESMDRKSTPFIFRIHELKNTLVMGATKLLKSGVTKPLTLPPIKQ
jgi:hypothetical protein